MKQNYELAKMAVANLAVRDRATLLRELTGAPEPIEPDRIVRYRDSAKRIGCTTRTIFSLVKDGTLTAVYLPGRKRALGVRESEISALVARRGP